MMTDDSPARHRDRVRASDAAPAKKLHLAATTYRGYERNLTLHMVPTLGRTPIRRLRYQQVEALYDSLLHTTDGRGLAPKSVYSIHLFTERRSITQSAEVS